MAVDALEATIPLPLMIPEPGCLHQVIVVYSAVWGLVIWELLPMFVI
jgi:hypothetical protein